MSGAVNWACFLASSTNRAYFVAIRPSAPQAVIMRMLAKASLATAVDLASAYLTYVS